MDVPAPEEHCLVDAVLFELQGGEAAVVVFRVIKLERWTVALILERARGIVGVVEVHGVLGGETLVKP